MAFDCRSCPRASEGDFYTEPENCLFCASPHEAAPELIGWHEEGGHEHCLFKKQPATPQELEDAMKAMHASCIDNLRYRGRDPKILRLLEDRGLCRQCDHPLRWWQRLFRR